MKRDTYTQAAEVQNRLYDALSAASRDLRQAVALHRSDELRDACTRIATLRARFDAAGAAYNHRRKEKTA